MRLRQAVILVLVYKVRRLKTLWQCGSNVVFQCDCLAVLCVCAAYVLGRVHSSGVHCVIDAVCASREGFGSASSKTFVPVCTARASCQLEFVVACPLLGQLDSFAHICMMPSLTALGCN